MRERGGGGLILRDPLPKRLKLSNRSTIGDGNRNHYMFMGRNAIQLLKSSSFWRLLHGMEQFVSSNIKWKKLNVKQCVQVDTNSVKEGQQPEHLFYVNLPPPPLYYRIFSIMEVLVLRAEKYLWLLILTGSKHY